MLRPTQYHQNVLCYVPHNTSRTCISQDSVKSLVITIITVQPILITDSTIQLICKCVATKSKPDKSQLKQHASVLTCGRASKPHVQDQCSSCTSTKENKLQANK
jgi:hypothetical protein